MQSDPCTRSMVGLIRRKSIVIRQSLMLNPSSSSKDDDDDDDYPSLFTVDMHWILFLLSTSLNDGRPHKMRLTVHSVLAETTLAFTKRQ